MSTNSLPRPDWPPCALYAQVCPSTGKPGLGWLWFGMFHPLPSCPAAQPVLPSRTRLEQPKSKSTQPRFTRRGATLYTCMPRKNTCLRRTSHRREDLGWRRLRRRTTRRSSSRRRPTRRSRSTSRCRGGPTTRHKMFEEGTFVIRANEERFTWKSDAGR